MEEKKDGVKVRLVCRYWRLLHLNWKAWKLGSHRQHKHNDWLYSIFLHMMHAGISQVCVDVCVCEAGYMGMYMAKPTVWQCLDLEKCPVCPVAV